MLFYEGSRQGKFIIYDDETDFKAWELNPSALEKIGGPEYVSLRVHDATGLLLPMYRTLPPSKINNSIDLGQNWFAGAHQSKHDLSRAYNNLPPMLQSKNVIPTEELVDTLIQTPLKCKTPDMLSRLSEGLLDYVDGDMSVTRIIQSRILVDDVEFPHQNITYSNIQSNDETIGLRLPDADVIISHVLGEEYDSTGFESTFNVYPRSAYKQYPNRFYKLRHIEPILATSNPAVRKQKIQEAVDYYTSNISSLTNEDEKLIAAFEVLPIEHVLGNPENDTVDIYDNERNYYENLIAFIKFHIKKFNQEVMISESDEAIEAKSEEDFNTGNLPVRLTEYLSQILKDVLVANFYHTGNFDYQKGDIDKEEDDDGVYRGFNDNSDDKTLSIHISKQNHTEADLDKRAEEYLMMSSKRHTASVWAEGIIKVMRWGDRKVRNLNVGVNNTQYLDMKSLVLVTQDLSDLSQFEVDKDPQGRSLNVMGYSYCDFTPKDSRRAVSYPFVLLGKEYGYVPSDPEEYSISYATTLFDIVRSYTMGKPSVFYINFDGEKFVDELKETGSSVSLVELSLEQLISGKPKIKILDELTDYAIDNNVVLMHGTSYGLLNQEALGEYMSDEPLTERLVETPKPMRTSVVQGALLKLFQEGAKDYSSSSDSIDLVDLLNWYYNEVYPTHLEAYTKMFGLAKVDEAVLSKINAKNFKAAHFFTEPEIDEQEEERPQFMYKVYDGPELQFVKIIYSAANPKIVGGYAVLPNKTMVFAAPDEITSLIVNSQDMPLAKVIARLFEVMVSADTTNIIDHPNQVMSNDTMHKIYLAIVGK